MEGIFCTLPEREAVAICAETEFQGSPDAKRAALRIRSAMEQKLVAGTLEPEWLSSMDKLIVELRDGLAEMADHHIIIAEEFVPLQNKVRELHGHLDRAMVAAHPEAMPEADSYRDANDKKWGENTG